MSFAWDEAKRRSNLEKHGVDFALARLIFNGPTLEGPDDRRDYGEARFAAYGVADGEVLFVIYTRCYGRRRLISARKAGTDEKAKYHARIAGGDDG